eukprot:jgi/Hompol1/2830/HPOL_003047-RA
MMFKSTFVEQYNTVKLGVLSMLDAFRSITKSKGLPNLLMMILSIGNFLNAQSGNQAKAFRVNFLEKIIDIKPVNGTTTALHLIATVSRQKFPEIAELTKELSPLRQISPGQLTSFEEDMRDMNRGMQMITKELGLTNSNDGTEKASASVYEQSDLFVRDRDSVFVDKLRALGKEVKAKVGFLETEYAELVKEAHAVLRYFGEPTDTKMTVDELVNVLVKFLTRFEVSLFFCFSG